MQVRVRRITIPPFSGVAHGWGNDVETGKEVQFTGDHRPMRDLGEAIRAAETEAELPIADVPDYAVISN